MSLQCRYIDNAYNIEYVTGDKVAKDRQLTRKCRSGSGMVHVRDVLCYSGVRTDEWMLLGYIAKRAGS